MQNKYENNYFWPFSIRFSTKKLNFDGTFLQKFSVSISLRVLKNWFELGLKIGSNYLEN